MPGQRCTSMQWAPCTHHACPAALAPDSRCRRAVARRGRGCCAPGRHAGGVRTADPAHPPGHHQGDRARVESPLAGCCKAAERAPPPAAAGSPRCWRSTAAPAPISCRQANILFGLPEDRARLAAAVHAAGFSEDVARMGLGLATAVAEKGSSLSGG